MGVDFLDIMFRLEKSLGIRFEREDFNFTPGGKYSVGEFYDLVEQKVCKASREILNSPDYWEKTFNEVRQVFAEGLGLPESDRWTKEMTIRELNEQIPKTKRRKTWINFKKQRSEMWTKHGIIVLSMLRYVDPKHDCLFSLACVGYVFFVTVLPFQLGQWLFQADLITVAVWFLPGSLIWWFLWMWYDDYRKGTIQMDMTLEKIADRVILRKKKSLKEDGSPYTREEIENIVKAAICEALAVKPELVTPEADLVRDLGME
jgi:acyl carrier protein